MASGITFGLSLGSVFGLSIGIGMGLIEWRAERKEGGASRWRKFVLSLSISLCNGLFVGLLVELFTRLSPHQIAEPIAWLFAGSVLGLVVGLANELLTVVRHYTLRFWLWRSHLFPLKAVPFLEDATARFLLRRIGGGYSFTHRLLLDYFADLETTPPAPSPEVPPSPQPLP